MKWTTGLVVAAMLGFSALTGCSGGQADGQGGGEPAGAATASGPAAAEGGTFAVITHAGSGDAFWDVVKNGAEAAGRRYGVTVSYQGDGDPARQSQLVDQAVSQKADGVVVSMANPDALKESVEKAVAAGIPVITINSGGDRSREFGAITHVGQSEEVAGRGAGEKLKAEGSPSCSA
ncbi:substrate-binding domain-containing protein [Streptosporangium lutulentum]